MEPNFGDTFESSISSSSSSSSSRDGKVDKEAVNDLLEECWFFENLFKRKTRMLRCYSDPSCPSSKVSQNITKNTIPAGDGAVQRTLIRAPSLPPCIGRKMEESQEKEKSSGKSNKLTRQSSHQHLLQALPKPVSAGKEEGTEEKESATRSKSKGQTSRSNLQRAPSLPSYLSREDISQDKESDTRMSKLIQQAFANSSDILPKPHTSKGLTRSYSISRYRPPRSPEVESNNYNMNGINEMSRRYLNQSKSRKSPSDLESEEVQGFKDLGFTFEKQELSPSVVNILPGLQEKNNREELNQEKMRRPYLSEAWLTQNCAPPPVPNWTTKNSSEDNMKAQIKFWARAVATNVRQEC
ncbi:hypothetical protein ACOSP7_030909 [Xanthoceras sorbifolium]